MRESDCEALQIPATEWQYRALESTPSTGDIPVDEWPLSFVGDLSWMDAAIAGHGDGSSSADVYISDGVRGESAAPALACDLTRAVPLLATERRQQEHVPAEVRLDRIREKNRAAQARFRQKQKVRTKLAHVARMIATQ